MSFHFAGELLHFNYIVDLELDAPSQEVYEYLLSKKWSKIDSMGDFTDFDFIRFSLLYLPKNSFIIFYFNSGEDSFVQFAKEANGNIFLDFPYKYPGKYYKKQNEMVKVLRSLGIKRSYRIKESEINFLPFYQITPKHKGNKGSMKVNFWNNYFLAAKSVTIIFEKVFEENSPLLYKYNTHRLQVTY